VLLLLKLFFEKEVRQKTKENNIPSATMIELATLGNNNNPASVSSNLPLDR
jgi:hypothetical protein